ncbi:sodium/proline symporter [Thermosyntropha lipolytica DSM 11003]|uniref:Sodium/proline symporter n=2 Tax=Thermosyntropha TaxID=54293 RepID=A0A1M5L7V3_9FIRM|nr:sodium:solute symporter [Thermosyntropha lipolytica]SHG61040.1 sodium/proline symporter [Thermosyntropha lipolytica DSM 11003]
MIMKLGMVVCFVAVIIGLSLYSRSKAATINDFVVGGRSIGPWMSAFSFGTTYFSAVLLIGFAGKVGWGYGLSALWIALGNTIIGTFLAWKILAGRTREMSSRLHVLTMPSFLEARYRSTNMKIFASLIIFIFFIPYSASVFMGLSYLFEQIFHIPYVAALILMTVLTALYLVLGGYIAIALVDFVLGIVMLAGVIVMVAYISGYETVGGFLNSISALKAVDPKLAAPIGPGGALGLISLVILTSLGTWGMPQMVQKFYGIKNTEVIPRATVVSTFFALVITGGAYFSGALSHLFFRELPVLNGKPSPDLLMPNIISQALPETVAVLILLLVLAASMSTLSGLVLVSSSSVTIDLIKGALFPHISEEKAMKLMRTLFVVFVGLSLWIALNPPGIILTLMALSWGTVAGAFLAPYLYGLFWERTTRAGAWAGMITGVLISLGGYFIINWLPYFTSYPLLTTVQQLGTPFFGALAMLVPLIVVPAVSLVTPEYSAEHISRIYGKEELVLEN